MRKSFFSVFLMLLFVACTYTSNDKGVHTASLLPELISMSKDTSIVLYMDLIDSSLKVNVRMVEYKAKVRNVPNSLIELSEISCKYGGYVSRDHTKNEKLFTKEQKYQEDTSQVITYYRTKSVMMLRIPHFYMDSVLFEIDKNLSFVDYKFSKVNDSLISRYSAHRFLNKENYRKPNSGEVYSYGNFSANTKYEKYIDQYVNSYGAIILTIYQNPETMTERIGHKKLLPLYKPSFWSQTCLELNQGFELVKTFWYFIMRFWPIFAIVFITAIIIAINYFSSDKKFHIKNWIDSPKI